MEKFQINLDRVAKILDPNRIPVKGNEHRLIRFAFDLFRVDGDETDDLWQIQADDDGNEFLVRTYSMPDEKVSEASDWSVMADKKYANLTVSFKGVPLTRLASKDYGVETLKEGKSLQGLVFRKLSSDGAFVLNLLSTLPKEKLSALKQAGLIEDIKNWLVSKDVIDPIAEEIAKFVEKKEPQKSEEPEEKPKDQDSKDKFEPQVPCGNLGADDEWSLAFLDLHLTKSAHCGECEQDGKDDSEFEEAWWDSGMETYGPSANSVWGQWADEKVESIEKAYHMIEHDLEPGSKEAVELSEFVDKVERGEEDYEDLEKLMKKLSENEADTCLAGLGIPRVADIQSTPDFYAPCGGSSGVDIVNLNDDVQHADEHEKFDVTDVESGQGEWEPEEVELTEEDIEEVDGGTKLVNPEDVKKILEEIKTLAPVDREALEFYLKS